MTIPILIIIAATLFYFLIVKGWLWKLLLLVFGWIGMAVWLHSFPDMRQTVVTMGNFTASWAIVIPTIVVILALCTTRTDD